MNITVLGCGALGQIWLYALQQQRHMVQGWLKNRLTQLDLSVKNINGVLISDTILANDYAKLRACELLIVTLKAWQVAPTLSKLTKHLPDSCPILLLQNGIGTLDEIGILPQPILIGITRQAAYRENGITYHTANGLTQIGTVVSTDNTLSYIATQLNYALPTRWNEHILQAQWMKLAINCIINPLTVKYNCCNGELLSRYTAITALCNEIFAVMQAEGLTISYVELMDEVIAVIRCTANNISSTLQDIRAGRQTEMDYITGYLMQRAKLKNINIPINSDLYYLVKNRECSK